MTKDEISKKLQELRISNGYTQKQLADMLGMKNYSTISSWEIGKSEPSLSMFARLCAIYGINDIEDVFPGVNINKKPTTDGELSKMKKDFIEFVYALTDDQVERVYELVQTALRLGEK